MQKEEPDDVVTAKKIIVFVAICLGMFMAILDIQIVGSSLSVIAAGLSASSDELSWVQTSYLIAEVMIIPATGFLARCLSTRISYFVATVGFTIMSVACALAWNIDSMIIFRALQGFFGGALIPTAFAAIFVIFPKRLQTKVTMFMGLIVTMAPTIGPTLGGYITEHLSWHFMFLINVIPGIIVAAIVFFYVDFDQPNYKLLNNFDLLGMLLMMFSLGALQYVLEEGNRKNWFEDTLIIQLVFLISVTFVSFIIRELSFINPIVSLKTFCNLNFTLGCAYAFILGIGLYGMVYLLPLFLFTVPGFNTQQIGLVMMVTGIFQVCSAPIAASLITAGLDKRIVLAIGYSMFSFGCYLNSFLTADSQAWELFFPQMLRGTSIMFCFMPINDLALGDLPPEEIQNASGLYNLTRNLGGAMGLAVISTLISIKTAGFEQAMNDHISYNSSLAMEQIAAFARIVDGKVADPTLASYYLLENTINREAFILAINNIFTILSYIFIAGLFFIPLIKPTKVNSDNQTHGH